MALSVSSAGLALIKEFEGCKLTAYKDPVGVWTIGYGHTSGVKEGQTITQAQADAYLKSDCASAESNVNSFYSTYKWNQNQFDALVSFAFNIGSINQLTAKGTRTIAEISAKIPAYNKAGGKVLAGLTRRRAAEKALFDTAVAASNNKSNTTSSSNASSSSKSSTTSSSSKSSAPSYTVGKVYTIQVDKLAVRKDAGTKYAALNYSQLTANAKKNAYSTGRLKKGTRVTCKGTKTNGNEIWMKIPSGYIAAYYDSEIYVK